MIHVTNGDAAAEKIRATGVLGDVIPWRDVLHEGPVPGNLPPDELRRTRAAFIAGETGDALEAVLAEFEARDREIMDADRTDEVVLWFEHDLFDQLQLLQVADMLARRPEKPAVSLAQADTYLTSLGVDALRSLYTGRRDLTNADLKYAARAWKAFTADDPRALVKIAEDKASFPFVTAAMRRHLEQFPDVRDGLSRTERQILASAVTEPISLGRLFERQAGAEDAVFLGDLPFLEYVRRLIEAPTPLVRLLARGPLGDPQSFSSHAEYWDRQVAVTEYGAECLAGKRDWLAEQGIDRWLGGVHLTGPGQWRWDPDKRRPVKKRS